MMECPPESGLCHSVCSVMDAGKQQTEQYCISGIEILVGRVGKIYNILSGGKKK
jgi:hypothetical protein